MTDYHLGDTIGAAFIGVVVAAALYGVTVLQGYYYYTHQKDLWSIKLLVGLVLLFETVHQILITHSVYHYVITNYGNPEALGHLIWSFLVEIVFNGLTALLVQSFQTMRVWKLSHRKKWLTGIIALLVAAEFASIIAFTTLSLQLDMASDLIHLEGLSITVNALAAAADVLIAGSLCTILYKSRTGFQKSDTMIKKLIMYSVNTGLLTSLCAVASLIAILAARFKFYYIMFFFCIGRLYSNSLLATLNARKKIREAAEAVENTSSGIAFSLREFSGPSRSTASTKHPRDLSIRIDTTTESRTDVVNGPEPGESSGGRRGWEVRRDESVMTFARNPSISTISDDEHVV